MLKEIRCDIFDERFKHIPLRKGVNIILGDIERSNALGKTSLLKVIDYCFGGMLYKNSEDSICEYVGHHKIEFVFEFNGVEENYYRDTMDDDYVYKIKENTYERIKLKDFKEHLTEMYGVKINNIIMDDLLEHYFRIYGRENSNEKYPCIAKRKEKDADALAFLIRVFGDADLLDEIKSLKKDLGVSSVKETNKKYIEDKDIECVKQTICDIEKRLEDLLSDKKLTVLGLNVEEQDKVLKLENEINMMIKKRKGLINKKESLIAGNEGFCNEVVEADLESLSEFFENLNIKKVEEVQYFHKKIRDILKKHLEEDKAEIDIQIKKCNDSIERIKTLIEDVGYDKELKKRLVQQYNHFSNMLEQKRKEYKKMLEEKEKQDLVCEKENQLSDLLNREGNALRRILKTINKLIADTNKVVTNNREKSAVLFVGENREIRFITRGNTSETTAFKSLILYDIAILKSTNIPAIMHDSNILTRVSGEYLERLFQIYEVCQKQSFVVIDDFKTLSSEVIDIFDKASIIEFSKEHRLYGKSWTNANNNNEEVVKNE